MAPDSVDHKLAAILSADAVGYSRLMADDETATIHTLRAYREKISELVRAHRGRVVDAPGDNVLAELPTALEAVRCAVEMQSTLAESNASLPEARRMDFRIGVHMGDVATEGGAALRRRRQHRGTPRVAGRGGRHLHLGHRARAGAQQGRRRLRRSRRPDRQEHPGPGPRLPRGATR